MKILFWSGFFWPYIGGSEVFATNLLSELLHKGHEFLVIAGDGPTRPELERQVSALGLTEMTDFLGWVSPEKTASLINKSTIVIMPSRIEPFGLVALETPFMARPIVATNVGGLKEVVSHGQTGLLFEPEDVSGLAEGVIALLKNPALAINMSETARRRAKEVFSFERHVYAYEQLYHRVGEKN